MNERGERAMARLEALAKLTSTPPALTRLFLSPEHRQAAEQVTRWLRQAGCEAVGLDAIGNVVGRYEGERAGLPSLLVGSHIDTVRDAGRYDGALGVVAAIALIEGLRDAGQRLPFAVEAVVFGDEEGVRFPTALSGSQALAGTFAPESLEAEDGAGITLQRALTDFGLDPSAIPTLARRRDQVLGFVEVHIEQGPILEAEGIPLGIVTSISGLSRFTASFRGTAGHAGTVPMTARRDALAAAAEAISTVEARCRSQDDVVGTVGVVGVHPGASNVIPGEARLTVDLRAPNDATREELAARVIQDFEALCQRRRIELSVTERRDSRACQCSPRWIEELEAVFRTHRLRPYRLPSGAGHDAMAMAALTEVVMLFVRCRGGVSHHPDEAISVEDAEAAIQVLIDFVRRIGGSCHPRR